MIVISLVILLKTTFNKLRRGYLIIISPLKNNYLEYILLKVDRVLISLV